MNSLLTYLSSLRFPMVGFFLITSGSDRRENFFVCFYTIIKMLAYIIFQIFFLYCCDEWEHIVTFLHVFAMYEIYHT
jgi:hypothetical protein